MNDNEKSKSRFTDPYGALPATEKTNTSITVGDADRALVFSVYPHQSVVQVTINTLFAEFVRALKANGFKTYDPEGFKEALRTVKITFNKKKKEVVSHE